MSSLISWVGWMGRDARVLQGEECRAAPWEGGLSYRLLASLVDLFSLISSACGNLPLEPNQPTEFRSK